MADCGADCRDPLRAQEGFPGIPDSGCGAGAGPRPFAEDARAEMPAQVAAGLDEPLPEPPAEPTVPLEQHQRLLAEFDNYRKRVERERERSARWIRAELMGRLLPTMDDIDRARWAAGKEEKSPDTDGMLIIMDRLAELLKREGLVEIQAGPGDVFDPNIHEAVLMVPSAEAPEGCIAAVLEKGYRVADRLLRPAKVAVARAPDAPAEAEEG